MKRRLYRFLVPALFLLGIILLGFAYWLSIDEPVGKFAPEFIRSLVAFSFTVIFGGIIKLIFDAHQEQRKHDEDVRLFKLTLLNQLRKVFDDVDRARLIIEAHRSVHTYSEQVQQKIIPSVVTLFDIKRSLVDSNEMMADQDILRLRLNIHYMIAYLQALADEYRENYLELSNKQYIHDSIREKETEKFTGINFEKYQDNLRSDSVLLIKDLSENISKVSDWVWSSINGLTHMGLLIEDSHFAPYRKMFVDFYEDCKRVLKDSDTKKRPDWCTDYYIEKLKKGYIPEEKSIFILLSEELAIISNVLMHRKHGIERLKKGNNTEAVLAFETALKLSSNLKDSMGTSNSDQVSKDLMGYVRKAKEGLESAFQVDRK